MKWPIRALLFLFLAAPLAAQSPTPVVVTDGNGKQLTITNATTGTQVGAPTPVVLTDKNGNALVLGTSSGGGLTITCSTADAFIYWLTSTTGACDSAITTNTAGQLSVNNTGTFVTGTYNGYLKSNLNSCNPATEFFANHSQYATDAIEGCGAMPNTGTNQVNGVAGYANTSGSSAAGGYFQCRPLVNNSFCDGENDVAQDVAGLTTGVSLLGSDVDVYPLNGSGTYSILAGYNAALHASIAGGYGNGFVCQQFGGGVGTWGTCFDTGDNATSIGLNLGLRGAAGASVGAQSVQFKWEDAGSVGHQEQFNVNSSGQYAFGGGNGFSIAGSSSGNATLIPPAVAGTSTNPFVSSNIFQFPNGAAGSASVSVNSDGSGMFYDSGTGTIQWALGANARARLGASIGAGFDLWSNESYAWNANAVGSTAGTVDTSMSRCAAGLICYGTGANGSLAGYMKSTAQTVTTAADVTCGTTGTIASCTTAQTITGLTFTLPLSAQNWVIDCDGVVGEATAATSNQWLIQTATNGATSTTASYNMATAATASAFGAATDVASTTTAFQITPSWTLGGTATKMPFHIHATITGASASGTVVNIQVIDPTVGDLLTIYEGASCIAR